MPHRLNAITPDKKPVNKSFVDDNYSKYQVKIIEQLFKKHIKEGGTVKSYIVPKYWEIPDEQIQKVKIIDDKPHHKEIFPRMHIDKLELPDNGNMSFCCIGSTRSGKSYATTYIYEKIFKKYITFLMTLTTHGDIYKPFKKNAVVCEGFNSGLINEAIDLEQINVSLLG